MFSRISKIICTIKCYFGYASLISRNDMLRNDNKVFTAAPSSVGFAATFSPRAKALITVLKANGLVDMLGFFTKDFYAAPFRGIATSLRFLAMT